MRAAAIVVPVVPEVLATGMHDGREVIVMSWCLGRPIGELIVDGGDPLRLGVIFGRTHAELNDAGICHLDFQPFNVLSDGQAITGIVDWSNARRADPRLDIARTRVILEFAPALLPADVVTTFTSGWADGYRSVRPMPDDDQLAPFLAEAAARQRADWLERAEAGEVPAAVAEVADAIARRWV